MVKKACTGNFIALYGMEWGKMSEGGHVIIYGYDSLIGWEEGLYDAYNDVTDYQHLFELVTSKKGAFAYLAHPEKNDFNELFTADYNAKTDRAVIGIAVETGPALGKNGMRTDYCAKSSGSYDARYRDLLKLGYHVAPGMDHDTHYSNFGKMTQRRLVVLAKELTQKSLMDAFKNMRFYASDDYNFKVDFSIDNAVMGESFTSSTTPQLKIKWSDEDFEKLIYIRLYYGESGSGQNAKYQTLLFDESTQSYTNKLTHFEKNKNYYYYLELKQVDGHKIRTAPIWYTNK